MPKNRPAATIGRTQPGRPPAPIGTPLQADGPRSLAGALIVPIEQIVPDPQQPRIAQDAARLAELAASLQAYGVLQPLLVREDGFLDDGRTRYMIVAGGRRYAAAQLAGLSRLPVVVRDSEGAALRLTQLVENIQRQALAPLDEARAFKEIMDTDSLSAEALGERLHISGQQIRERLRLLADQSLADAVERRQIAPSVARAIQRLPDDAQQPLRIRIQAGESLPLTEVQAVKDRSASAGVKNPRAKGGGRARRADQAVLDPVSTVPHQAVLDPASTHPQPVAAGAEEFRRAVQALDQHALRSVLRYGAERQWTCANLLTAIDE